MQTNLWIERAFQLVRRVHEAMSRGLDDSEECERVRTEFDEVWERLSEDERKRVGKYSEQLYKEWETNEL